ncbi:hypothetical protein POM88_034799 [Heracleum sosnowskyi]|uniref:CCHC-type domain-containing protein n=1 Tax=Heracleum sosnowskyi TaxID=360622 RepID=A0AAD8HJZ3_9APIA|nr:hypothetical protein POM88_034799 [Heracleum sosnowskyi]
MLRTHDLEVQQRKNKKGSKARSIALKAEAKSKGKVVEVSRRKTKIVESDPDDSSSDTDGNPDANTDDDSSDSDMEEMVAMIVRSFKKMKFRKARRQGNFQKRTFNADKDKYIKKDSKGSKFDKSKVRCYKCNGMGHFASECKKTKALITSCKDWMDSSSESDTEVVNYALMANTDDTAIPDDKEPEESESDPDDPSNPDVTPNTDGANSDDANNGNTTSSANVEGEQQHSTTSSESTQSSGLNSSDTDSSDGPDNSSGRDINYSGGASTEANSSKQDNTNPGGASTSRNDLPPARKWTASHTPDLIIGDPDADAQANPDVSIPDAAPSQVVTISDSPTKRHVDISWEKYGAAASNLGIKHPMEKLRKAGELVFSRQKKLKGSSPQEPGPQSGSAALTDDPAT